MHNHINNPYTLFLTACRRRVLAMLQRQNSKHDSRVTQAILVYWVLPFVVLSYATDSAR
jgi:hypothetical protein